MEDWQRKLILTNLPQLIEYTDCNVEFLAILQARNILSRIDAETINQVQTKFGKADKLYSILDTKAGAFNSLKYALDETRQSGALRILTRFSNHGTEMVGGLVFDHKDRIGLGRYGTKVYKGVYGNKEVAVKKIQSDDMDFDKFLSDIRQLIVLETCKNVVRTFAFETTVSIKQIFVVLELCETNLDGWLCNNCNYPDCETSREQLLLQILHGINHLHTCGIIHMNIKPSNILIKLKNNTALAKISNAGISKVIDDSMSSLEVSSGVKAEGWMSPEVLLRLQEDDGKFTKTFSQLTKETDVFSLGCLMYYVLTNGHHPFGIPLVRNFNIVKKESPKLNLEDLPSSTWLHLIKWMIMHKPECRPSIELVLCHPVFWDRKITLQFLLDLKPALGRDQILKKKILSQTLQVRGFQKSRLDFLKPWFSEGQYTVEHFLNVVWRDHDTPSSSFQDKQKSDNLPFPSELFSLLQSFFPFILHDIWYEARFLRNTKHLKKYFRTEQDGKYLYPDFPKYNRFVLESQSNFEPRSKVMTSSRPTCAAVQNGSTFKQFSIRMKPRLASDCKKFAREAFISLNYTKHLNVLNYHEVQWDLIHYKIKCDHYDIDLKEWLGQNYNYINRIDLSRQILDGLMFLHNQNILHLDLKPSNIVRGWSGFDYCPKICNFGNAKMVGNMETGIVLDKTFKGTDGWIPPEVFQFLFVDQSKPVYINQAADVFNLGLLFYFILTNGNHAFGSFFERRINIMKGSPQMHYVFVLQNISFRFWSILFEMIQNDKDKRPTLASIAASNNWES